MVGSDANTEDSLCAKCQKIDFDRQFLLGRTRLDLFWNVGDIKSNSRCCVFCRMILSCIDADAENISDSSIEECSIWGHWSPIGEYRITSNMTRLKHLFTSSPQAVQPNKASDVGSKPHIKSLSLKGSTEKWLVYKFIISFDNIGTGDSINRVMRPRDAIQCILPLARGLKLDSEKDRVLRCRPINLAQVDFNLVRDWINTCQKEHKKCRRFMTSSRLMSMFGFSLIDVQREALVDAPRGAKYLALSYVWGSARQLKLVKANRVALYTPGYLSERNEEIPKTIRDAIYVCKALRERYLWVDALCIIQDDEADKKVQISNMDLVYRNAYITIVGADGDATTGLSGTRTNYPRREAVKASIQGLMLSSAPSELPEVLSRSLWATRGWTLQEQLMSRRLLVFTDRIVYFNCQETTFREDVTLEASEGEVRLMMWKSVSRIPNTASKGAPERNLSRLEVGIRLEDFRDIVSQYCSRSLSHERDILNAFLGVMKCFEPTLGEFQFGIPIRFIGLMLLWGAKDRFPVPRGAAVAIPSWSWAAWKDYEFSLDSKGGFLQNGSCPLQFFTLSGGGECTPILSSDLINNAIYHVRLHGEIKKHCQATTAPSLSKALNFTTKFLNHSYLVIWTSTAFFHVDQEPTANVSSALSYQYTYEVRDKHGSAIGKLALNHELRKSRPGQVEFIMLAISNISYLHVMAIEWVDDIAQRLQILDRPVAQERWMAAYPHRKLIVLG